METIELVMLSIGCFWLVVGITFAIFMIWMKKQYRHTYIIHRIQNAGMQTIIRKAREKLDKKTKVITYKIAKLKKPKNISQMPPDFAMTHDDKGNKVIECFMTESGEIFFLQIHPKISEIPKNIFANIPEALINIADPEQRQSQIDQWKRSRLTEWMREKGIDAVSHPITTNQRIMHFSQIEKANEGMKKTLIDFLPSAIVVVMALMLIIQGVVMAAMWKDITEPSLSIQQVQLQQQTLYQDTAKILERISSNTQQIESKVNSQAVQLSDLAQKVNEKK